MCNITYYQLYDNHNHNDNHEDNNSNNEGRKRKEGDLDCLGPVGATSEVFVFPTSSRSAADIPRQSH